MDTCILINEISFEPQMKTISMLMILAVVLCYLSRSLYLLSTAYHRPTEPPVPSRPDSSTGEVLHRHRRGQGSNPIQALISNAFLMTSKIALKKL